MNITRHYHLQADYKWTHTPPSGKESKWWRPTYISIPSHDDLDYAVADLHSGLILLFDDQGYSKGHLGSPTNLYWRPFSITQGPDNCLAVTDWAQNCIQMLSVTGENRGQMGRKILNRPGDITLTCCGNWIISDLGKRCVFIMDPFGNLITEIKGQPVKVGPSNHQKPGDNNYTWFPEYVATDSHQRIIVTDFNSAAVDIFDPTGEYLTTLKGTHLSKPNGVTVDSEDNILVCDQSKHRVALFDPNGSYIKDVIDPTMLPVVRGSKAPDFWRPITIAYNHSNGDLAIGAAYADHFTLQAFGYLKLNQHDS